MIKVCGRCGSKLIPSEIDGYDYQCVECDEDFYEFELYVKDNNEYRIDELKKQIKYLKDKMNVCAYGKQDIEELMALENELNKLMEE